MMRVWLVAGSSSIVTIVRRLHCSMRTGDVTRSFMTVKRNRSKLPLREETLSMSIVADTLAGTVKSEAFETIIELIRSMIVETIHLLLRRVYKVRAMRPTQLGGP